MEVICLPYHSQPQLSVPSLSAHSHMFRHNSLWACDPVFRALKKVQILPLCHHRAIHSTRHWQNRQTREDWQAIIERVGPLSRGRSRRNSGEFVMPICFQACWRAIGSLAAPRIHWRRRYRANRTARTLSTQRDRHRETCIPARSR